MGEYRDFLRYALISLLALAAIIVFWNILVTYLGDVAVFLYRYEATLIPVMLLIVGIMTVSALHLEPKKILLYPFRWIRLKLGEPRKNN
jgi:hypothetical protein